MDSIRARAREETFVQVEEEVEGDAETLDKEKKYHKCYNRVDCRCYHMSRSARTHIPLIELDGSG